MGVDLHRDGVVWFLGRGLEGVGECQRGMMERRLEREMERGRSVLYKIKGGGGGGLGETAGTGINGHATEGGGAYKGAKGLAVEDESRREIEQQLNPEQLQLFERENRDMLKHYDGVLDQARFVCSIMVSDLTITDVSSPITGQQNARCSKYPSCRPRLYRTLIFKVQTSHS